MSQPALAFLNLIDRRQEGLLTPSFFSYNVRRNLFKKLNLIQECYVVPSPTRGCTMRVCDDSFILAPSRSSKLLLFKYDIQRRGYKLKATTKVPRQMLNGELHFSSKYIDYHQHAFTATSCDNKLHYGDPETFRIIECIQHPDEISQHRISTLCPFNAIVAGCKGHIYIADFRTGSVVMNFLSQKSRGPSTTHHHSVAWSPFSDRVVCSLKSSPGYTDVLPLSVFDLRKPDSKIGNDMKCDFLMNTNDHVEDVVPYVDFLESGDGSQILSLVNDSHVRIWNIITGELTQTIIRETGTTNFDHSLPAVLPLDHDSFIFVADRTGIKVNSCTKHYYSLKVPECIDISVLGFNKLSSHLIGLSSYTFKSFYVWECGRAINNMDGVNR